MAQDNILDNIAVNDLNLEMTNEDISILNNLTDESKSILGVTDLQETPVLSEQNTTSPPASNSTGPLDALSTTSASLIANEQQTRPTTTIKPTSEQIVNGILFNIRQKSPFAPYAPVSGGINVPEEQTRRYREGPAGYVYGRDNEDAQARAEGIWTNLGKGLLRLPTATGIKIGQTVGFIEGLINPTNWGSGYLENASNNAITGVFNQLDDEMKNNWLPVYRKADAEGKGFWWKATNDMNFWTSDVVDGAAFMMSAFVPGGILAKLGLGARIARGLSALKIGANTAEVAIEGAATAENYLAKAQSIFASKIDKVNQWALSVVGEAMFESTEVGDNIRRGLTYDENGQIKTNLLTGLPYTEQEKTEIAGSHMKSSFLSNAALLSATNAFELKWINSILGKTEGKVLAKNLKGGLTLGDDLAFNISNHGIERLLNSKVGLFTKGLGRGIFMEGFVEENAQLAIQRVNEQYGIEGKVAKLKDQGEMFSQYFKQTKNALTGNDPEAALSIGLGGILGGGMSAVSGMKEFSRNKIFTENAIKFYNESQQQWLKFGNIYETKTTTTKDAEGNDVTSEQIVLDKNNQPIINSAKLFNIANNFSNAAGAIEAGNIEQNKLQRDILRDTAFADFVTAHIQLGIENEITYKLNAVDKTDAAQLIKMGVVLDANSKQEIQKYKSLSESIIAQNKLLNDDIIFNTDWKGNMLEEEQARKHKMTEIASQQAVYKGILADLNRDASNFNNEILKTVEGNTSLSDSFVDQINELQLKINSQKQVVEELSMGKGSAIKSAMAKTVLNQLTSQMATLKKDNSETLKTIKKGDIGFYEYEKSYRNDDINKAITLNYYLKLARKGQIDNHIKQIGLEWAKYADTKNGMKNFKEYIDNVITNPINEALERAERGKSAKITEEQRKERAKNRTPKDYESRTPWVKKGTNATFLYRFKDDNRIAEDIMEYYDTQDGETVSLAPMIQKILNNPYTDPYLKSILEKLLPKIKVDAKVKFDMKQTYAPGYYEVGTGTITIDPALHETKMSFEGVMLHEIMHLLTSDELQYGNSKFTKDIEQIYEYTKKNLEDRGIDPSYYGFTNIHEFIAEAYSNPEFQKELSEIPGKTGAKSTWAEFMDALSAFFTKVFNLDIKPSALDDIFFKVEEYLDEDVLKEAKKQLKDNGLTDEEISRYSNHELIDMALNEGYITNDFITKSLKKNEPTPPPVPVQTPTTNINQDIEYSYNGKKYGIFVLGDEVYLLNPTDTEDSMTLTEAQFKDLMTKGQIKPFKETQTGVAPTLEEHLQKVYNQAKTAADASNRTIASYEDWKKTAGKFEAQRYEKLVNPPKPVETKTPTELEAKKADIERLEKEADDLLTKGINNYRYEREQRINKGEAKNVIEREQQIEWLKTKDGIRYQQIQQDLINLKTYFHGTAEIRNELNSSKSKTSENIFLTENEDFANSFSFNDEFRPNGVTYTANIDVKKTFQFDNPLHVEQFRELIRELVKSKFKDTNIGINFNVPFGRDNNTNDNAVENPTQEQLVDLFIWRLENGSWRMLETKPFDELLTKLGYDSFKIVETKSNTIAVKNNKDVTLVSYKNKSGVESLLSKEKTNYAEQIKVNNEFAEPDGTTYKIASIIPGKTVSYIKTTPEGTSSVEKEPIDSFTKKLEDGAVTLQQTAFVGEDDTKNNVKDFVQNNRFNTSGLNSTSEDNNTANVSFQEGRKQIAPHNSLANTTDLIEEQVVGNQVRYIRVGVNNNYVFDIATGNFMPGSSVTYKVRTDDFEAVRNRITGETYDKSKVFDSNGKIIPGMFDYAPIGIYSIIDGKETLIGNLHEPQWIEYKIGDKYPNIVIPESELDQAVPATLKKELEKNRKLRNFILENHNKDSKFEMNAVVEAKSIGIIRTVAQSGPISERVNPKISEGGTSNKHGMFAIVRNGQLEVTKNVTIDGVENTKSFSENIDDQSGMPVLLVPTPTGTFFPTFIKIPTVNTNQASFILESWKAFTGQQDNPELVKAVYNAMGMQMSEGKPDIGVLQSYIDHYITILESDSLSAIGNGTDLPNNVARLNITNDGHLYIQSKLADQWYDNGGKPIVLADQLPDNVMAHLQNLLTTVKFAKGRNLKGINSIEKIPFVSIENGKVKISSMTYNEYIMQGASTYIEKGIESKNKNNDWVYFANPVIKMTTDTQGTENKIDSQKVEAVVEDKFEGAPPVTSSTEVNADDLFDMLDRAATANEMTDKQIEEQKKKC